MIKVDIFELTQNYLKSKLIKSKCYKVQAGRILITTSCTSYSNSLSKLSAVTRWSYWKSKQEKIPGGESAYERGGDARRKFWIKPLKETDLGVAQAFFDP